MVARVKIKVDPIDRDVALIISQELSPAARRLQFAEAAGVILQDADDTNRQILGRVPPNKTWVDGVEGAPLEAVRPNGGVIIREYQLVADLMKFIGEQLQQASPIGSGRDPHSGLYQKSHTLFADGVEIAPGGKIPEAMEYVFMDMLPYARKIEGSGARPPESKQAPKGVYELVAAQARKRFGNVARIEFVPFLGAFGVMSQSASVSHGQRTTMKLNKSENRFPAIRVTLGGR